jgi:hypothetical protein
VLSTLYTQGKQKETLPWTFHTCNQAVDVTIDAALQTMLMQSAAEDDTASDFEMWAHFQALKPMYNAV